MGLGFIPVGGFNPTNGKLVVWGPVVWDSNRGTPKKQSLSSGDLRNPNHIRKEKIAIQNGSKNMIFGQ